MKRTGARLMAALLGAVCIAAAAQDRNLAALPGGVSASEAIELARASLVARGWKILLSDATSVTAESGGSRIRVHAVGDALRYTDQADAAVRQRSDAPDTRFVPIPPEQITVLRADIVSALGLDAVREVRAGPAAPRATFVEGQVLIDNLPPGMSEAQVMRAVRDALVGRRWVILPSAPGEVTARLRKGVNNTTLRVLRDGNLLRYVDNTKIRVTQDMSEVPDRWISNLRSDIRRHLEEIRIADNARAQRRTTAEPGPVAAQPASGAANATERLRTLKQLFDSGAITQGEYDSKRAEILRGL